MARTQKNKATAYHIGTLKAKLAKLKRELIQPSGGGGGRAGEGVLRSLIFCMAFFKKLRESSHTFFCFCFMS